MARRVTLLLGKPPKPGTLMAEVARGLQDAGAEITLCFPHEQQMDFDMLRSQDLVAHRGLKRSVWPLLKRAHECGITLCPVWSAAHLLQDRAAWRATLISAGIPVPSSVMATGWTDVLTAARTCAVVVKSLSGPGRGVSVASGTSDDLPLQAPFPGPYVVEQRMDSDGIDRKLYVIGAHVHGLLKPSTLRRAHTSGGESFEPDPDLATLALQTAEAVGAHLIGVDVVVTPTGPYVVDLNPFPGYRGITDAPHQVTQHLLTHLTADR